MKNVIVMLGPNAIGKTTAVRRWCERYPNRLVGVLADSQIKIEYGVETPWKGWHTSDDMERRSLAKQCEQLNKVCVVEAASGYGVRIAKAFSKPMLFLVTCSGEASRNNIQRRCEAKGKAFKGEYWTAAKCGYDSSRRHVNFATDSLHKYVEVAVEGMEDWPAADQEFYNLFREINNRLLRDV
jgi:hypothetical protein